MNKKIFLIALVLFQFGRVEAANYAPVARIQSPENGSKFKVGEKITFKGKAIDLEDEELSGKNLIWTSDVDGYIGEGNSFSVTLSEGSHIIILTATDLEGSSGRDSVFITVGTPKITEPVGEVEKPGPEKSKLEPEIEKIKIEKQTVPSIVFLFVPSFGSFEDLQGQVFNADPNEFAVAVYIMVDGVWWSKSVIKINKDGKWACDITTAENDELAIKIVAYLIPIDYKPPLASGEFWILKEIEKNSLAKVEVTRKITPIKELPEQKAEVKKKPERAADKEDVRSYFPLAVGNSWKYKRMISPGKVPLIQFKYEVIEDLDLTGDQNHEILIIGFEPFAASRNETYKVLSKEDKNFVIEGYSIDEKGEKGETQGFEPYSLQELKKLIWRVNEWSDKTFVAYEIREGINLGNEVRSIELIGFFKPDRGLLIDVEPNDLGLEFEPKSYYKKVMAEYEREPIKVPAGTFSKTIKNTFEFIGGVKIEKVKIIRFFANNIGLVKEVQYDSKGEITYTLELVEYEVK